MISQEYYRSLIKVTRHDRWTAHTKYYHRTHITKLGLLKRCLRWNLKLSFSEGKQQGYPGFSPTSLREASRHWRLLDGPWQERPPRRAICEQLTAAHSLSSHVNRTRNTADYPWAGDSHISHPQMCSQSELKRPLILSYPQDAINKLLFLLLFLLLLVVFLLALLLALLLLFLLILLWLWLLLRLLLESLVLF
jgi:hypothetical protein